MSYPYEGYYPTMRDCERYAEVFATMYYTLLQETKERLRAEKAREAERRRVTLNVTINTIAPGKPDPEALREAFSQALEDVGVGSTWLTEDEELDCMGHALMRTIDEYTEEESDKFIRDLLALLRHGSVSAAERRRGAIEGVRGKLDQARALMRQNGDASALDEARAYAQEVADRMRDEALAEMLREPEDEE